MSLGVVATEDEIVMWLQRHGCSWRIIRETDGWDVEWSYQPHIKMSPVFYENRCLPDERTAFSAAMNQSFRAIDLHLAPPQDFLDGVTAAQKARQNRMKYFQNKKRYE